MKSSNRNNGKKVNRNLKPLTLNKAQWYVLGAFLFPWLSWLFEHGRDGLSSNHNEMFLADVS
jgi:hypothetical protein